MVLVLVPAGLRVLDPADPEAGEMAAGQPAGDRAGGHSGILVGIRALPGDPVLRAATLLITAVNTFGVGLDLIAVVILRDQSVSSAMIGVALAGGAVGGLAGAPLVRPLRRLPPGVLLRAVCALQVPVFVLLAMVNGPWWMAGLLFASMLGIPAIRVLFDVLILRQAPAEARGRVVGAVMTLFGLGMPVGFALAGLLLQFLSAGTGCLSWPQRWARASSAAARGASCGWPAGRNSRPRRAVSGSRACPHARNW